jgi:predicted RNase H-like HicB family nuclease
MPEFKVILIPEEDGRYSVQVPALPGCFTCGDTREEALEMAKDAIGLYLQELVAQGRSIPPDDVETVSIEVASPAA